MRFYNALIVVPAIVITVLGTGASWAEASKCLNEYEDDLYVVKCAVTDGDTTVGVLMSHIGKIEGAEVFVIGVKNAAGPAFDFLPTRDLNIVTSRTRRGKREVGVGTVASRAEVRDLLRASSQLDASIQTLVGRMHESSLNDDTARELARTRTESAVGSIRSEGERFASGASRITMGAETIRAGEIAGGVVFVFTKKRHQIEMIDFTLGNHHLEVQGSDIRP